MTTQQMLLGTGSSSLTFTFVTANSNTSTDATNRLVLSHPATVQAGDLCVLFHNAWDNDSDFIDTVPPGFTSINTDSFLYTTASYMSHGISYNIISTQAQTHVVPFGNGNTVSYDYQIIRTLYFRPDKTIATISPESSFNLGETTGNPAQQKVPAGGNNAPIIAFGQAKVLSVTGDPAFNTATSNAFDGYFNTGSGALNIESNVGYKIYNTSPIDHYVDMDDQGTNVLLSFYLRAT